MNIKKYILTQANRYIVAIIALIAISGGILGQQQTVVANQEIVLQFISEDISVTDAQHTINKVEQQLRRIGVDDIQISEAHDGKLTISYYSNTDVESIKDWLSKEKDLASGFVSAGSNKKPSLPLSRDHKTAGYNLDIYEIQDGQSSVLSLGGAAALEIKAEQHRFLNPNFYIPAEDVDASLARPTLKVTYTFQRYVAIAKDYRSHKVPEVRAGPSA